MPTMEGYRFVRTRTVEFRDVDVAGHVNNAVYVTYLETARIDYLREILGIGSLDDPAVIVANVNVDFRSPARFAEGIEIGTRVPRIGTKSFVMEHEVRGGDGRLVAEATSVLVAYDYTGGAPRAVPGAWRTRVEAFEERSSVPA
jgi:acyl-CoA thioester hydrolase